MQNRVRTAVNGGSSAFNLLTDLNVASNEDSVASADTNVAEDHRKVDTPLPYHPTGCSANVSECELLLIIWGKPLCDMMLALKNQLHRIGTAHTESKYIHMYVCMHACICTHV